MDKVYAPATLAAGVQRIDHAKTRPRLPASPATGFGGQAFIPVTVDKIARVKKLIGDRDIRIEVDGGIAPALVEVGRKRGRAVDGDLVVVCMIAGRR